jgi:FkbM family methyltransferase
MVRKLPSGKVVLRYLLESAVNRHRLNDSALYNLYLALRYPTHVALKRSEVQFYRQLLKETDRLLIFDIGANGGNKAIIFSALASKVISVEHSPTAVHILKERFEHRSNVVVVQSGVGEEMGSHKFYMFGDVDAYNTFSPKWKDRLSTSDTTDTRPRKDVTKTMEIPIVTLDELIRQYGIPAYIKIDVEGYKLNVIKGFSTSVPIVSFECNLPEFEVETVECISRLAWLQPDAKFNYTSTEPPTQFERPNWLSPMDIKRIVISRKLSFMEIYCKSDSSK